MALPIRTTLDDVVDVCNYLKTKPTGATLKEAKTVLDKKRLDGRKISALKFWELIDEDGEKLRLSATGREAFKNGETDLPPVLASVVKHVRPYAAVVERAVHRDEYTLSATDVAAHWHEHFKDEVADSDKVLNDQAVCFFQIAQGANLGTLTIGRKGSPTRFDFNQEAARSFVDGAAQISTSGSGDDVVDLSFATVEPPNEKEASETPATTTPDKNNKVFITHGSNKQILEQVKEIVTFGKFEPVVAVEHETVSKPVPDKVMDDMRQCSAAVIHVAAEGSFADEDGNPYTKINENVLIEIGAAMALYGRNFILLVEEGIELPTNLQGLYECRYQGAGLDGAATMKLLKAFNDFK